MKGDFSEKAKAAIKADKLEASESAGEFLVTKASRRCPHLFFRKLLKQSLPLRARRQRHQKRARLHLRALVV